MAGILDGALTSVTLCWTLERPDGGGVALCSHDCAVQAEGIRYTSAPGLVPATITRNLGLDPHEAEVAGALSADALAEGDLRLGRWDGAQARLTAVDWKDPEQQPVRLLAGRLGSVAIDGDGFSAEMHGAAARLDAPVCPSTSPECRARFGNKQCRVDLAGRAMRASIVGSAQAELTLDSAVGDRFVLGRLRYLSGENCGLATVVTAVTGSVITIRDLPRGAVAGGDRVELREGCDKRFETCVSRFANAANFRGEPHLPGNDVLTRYPGV